MTTPLIDDPARDLPPAAHSPAADAMLARILDTPRTTAAPARPAGRRPPSVRRIAVGGLLAAAAVTAAVTAPTPWGGHPSPADAFAVQRHDDGSVSVVVHWPELDHPDQLQRALDAAGAPVRILTGPNPPGLLRPETIPDCAKPYYGKPYSAAAVSWDSGLNAPDNSFVVHPAAFPKDGTLVIEVFFTEGAHHLTSLLSFMAIGRAPSCAIPG